MKWRSQLLLAFATVSASSALAQPERGDAGVETLDVEYEEFEGCPQRADFVREVMMRTPRARLSEPGEASRTVIVVLRRAGAATRGNLVLREASGAETTREVEAGSCEEAVSALALVTALAIDPHASTAPASELVEAAEGVGSVSGRVPPLPAAMQPAAEREAIREQPPATADRVPRDAGVERTKSSGVPLLGARIGAEIMSPILPPPSLSWGGGLLAEWTFGGAVAPMLALLVLRGEADAVAELGVARFTSSRDSSFAHCAGTVVP
jgi:hypothetical protein